MIWCVGLNPSLDVAYLMAEPLVAGGVYRTRKPLYRAGGKGNNVARTVRALGQAVTAVGILGGFTGKRIRELLTLGDIPWVGHEIDGETRQCVTVIDAHGAVTEIREPGPAVDYEINRRLLNRLQSLVCAEDIVTLSGSLPPNWPDDTYAEWIQAFRGCRAVLLDTSGKSLAAGLSAGPSAVLPNSREYTAIKTLAVLPGTRVIVTEGGQGARWIRGTPAGKPISYRPPPVPVVNTVGAGDAFLGGLAVALDRGALWDDALALAVATGSASVQSAAVGDVAPEEVRRLLSLIQIHKEGAP